MNNKEFGKQLEIRLQSREQVLGQITEKQTGPEVNQILQIK
jgi:hypothetical protein